MMNFQRNAQLALCALFVFIRHGATAAPMISPAFVSTVSRGVTVTPSDLTLSRRRSSSSSSSMHQSSALAAMADDNKKSGNTSKSAREQGIYARPSAAIEKGSGFFIPGLEGSRIRFLFGITVLLADAGNHALVGSRPGDWAQTVAEVLSAVYGALLLLQGTLEMGAERGFAVGAGNGDGIISSENEDGAILNKVGGVSRKTSDALQGNEAAAGMIQRMAQTIINFTPATYFRFVDEDLGVLYTQGVDEATTMNGDEEKRLINLSLDAVSESRGGRVALPSEHPASKLLPETATRCILVQKVDGLNGSRACLVIGSDKLLPSFTKNDLRWIGQLAVMGNY